ncbi:MAG: hypothetical protein LUQ50_03965 [Methanospirillum sp.]|uniref:hypothetical protein n=1 Tax=Methanospirillum sp. TaxID=45200 RepID=UPI00237215CD|nr:hypothetical protein [Methanospirillum sp.]MDD1728211.1 hypothetical protein [Methanospirillum sp.]
MTPPSDSRAIYVYVCTVQHGEASGIGSGCSERGRRMCVRSYFHRNLILIRSVLQDQTVIRPVMRSMYG